MEFFKQLRLIEALEMPYLFHPDENAKKIKFSKEIALNEMLCWKKEWATLYQEADREYVGIKRQKPMGPYLKHALALNVRPVFHNLIAFHLSSREIYAKQARQNIKAIMQRLLEEKCFSLHDFLTFLLDDMKNGPAVLD